MKVGSITVQSGENTEKNICQKNREKGKKDGATWRQQSVCEGWQHQNRAHPLPARSKLVPVQYAHNSQNSYRTSFPTLLFLSSSLKSFRK